VSSFFFLTKKIFFSVFQRSMGNDKMEQADLSALPPENNWWTSRRVTGGKLNGGTSGTSFF
jgi:hypothetical protein